MTRTYRDESEAEILADIRRTARVSGRRARKKRHDMIARRVNTRVARIVEARAQVIASQPTEDAKSVVGFFETWRQKKWSFL